METIKKVLEEKRPNKWDDIPDIDLYMDQVLSYMPRQHAGLELDENLTAAMVNNYIKKGLLPRAKGEKVQSRAYRLSDGNLSFKAGSVCDGYGRAVKSQD